VIAMQQLLTVGRGQRGWVVRDDQGRQVVQNLHGGAESRLEALRDLLGLLDQGERLVHFADLDGELVALIEVARELEPVAELEVTLPGLPPGASTPTTRPSF
jgi:predicted mannosyl-3-phosphoglycerate phosphatase (HAD superfamily)